MNRSLSNQDMKSIIIKYRIILFFLLVLTVGTSAQNINIPNKTGPMGLEVNTLTGNLYFTRNDLYIPARGFDLNITFHYNSFNYDKNDGYGKGWSFNYNIKYKNDTLGSKTIIWGDGREDNYLPEGAGYKAPRGFFSTLSEYQPGKYRITETDGTKYFFDNNIHKRITRMEEPNGNFINFNYSDTLLTALTNGAGQTISLAYTNGRLTSITDAITVPTRVFTYIYDGAGNLVEVKDPLNNSTKYAYLVNGPMKAVTDKNNNKVDIIYFNNFSISELIGCNKRLSFSYDSATHTTMVTDYLETGSNQVTKYEFKKQEDKKWLSGMSGNCCGFNMKFEFDAAGNKIKETDANGNVTTFTYDNRGNMLTMTDALNNTIKYTYTSDFNRVASFTDEKGFNTTMTYDVKGNLTQLTEPGNQVYSATYAANGDILNSTDPKGNSFSYNYDSYGNPVNVTGPNGYTAQLVFDARGNLLSVTDARGNTSNMEFDILGRLKKITDPINNNVQLNYDAAGNPISLINENNENSSSAFDASNRLVEITDPTGGKTTFTYDAMDNLKSIKNALGNTLNFEYDARNRIKKITDPEGNRLSADYDANGNLTAVNMPNGQVFNYSYDALNRLIAANDINGQVISLTYDKNSNVTSVTNGSGATYSAEYDSLNRVKKITDPLSNTHTLVYDKNSNIVAVTDRNGFTSTYTYDSLDRVKTTTDNNGNTISVTYDALGNVIALTDQNNNTTSYTYDNLNRLKRTTFPDGRYSENSYDNKSNIIAKRITDGSTITYTYDTLNRVISKTLPDGHVYTYTYDALGRLLTATNNAGTVTLTYDALNRLTAESFGNRTVTYSYNISGRTQSTVYPDSTIIKKSYDTRNRLISIAKNNTVLVSYQYNNANQVIAKTMSNGITTLYQYDFANRLSNISTAGGTIQNSQFNYDNEQQKTSINRLNDPARSEQFTYDNGRRLTNYKRGILGGTPVLENSYNYDALGNRTSANLNGVNTTYTSNNLNQLTNSNNGTQNINFTYDNNGNLTYDGQFYKFYDAEKRLLKDSSSPSNVFTYQYDALNRRTRKNSNGTARNYTFSGITPIEERENAGNTILNKTIYAGWLRPVVNEKNNNQFFYHLNELNSVEAITNQQGRLVEKYDYDVYGKMSIYDSLNNPISGSIAGNRFGFTGQEYDSATGKYKFFFREYNPETGLFSQRDLIGYADGMGMYQYVHNNPANGVDVLGLEDCPDKKMQTDFNIRVQSVETVGSLENFIFSTYELLHNEINQYNQNKTIEQLNKLQADWAEYFIKSLKKNNAAKWNAKKAQSILDQMKNVKLPNGAKIAEVANSLDKVGKGLNALDLVIKGHKLGNAINDYQAGSIDGAQLSLSVGDLAQSALNFTGVGSAWSFADFLQQRVTGKSMNEWSAEYGQTFGENDVDQNMDEELMEFHRKNGTIKKFLKFYNKTNIKEHRKRKTDCPQNNAGGTQKPAGASDAASSITEAISSWDPNEIIGPDGVPDKSWVSINDRLPYTVTFENDKSASAPAKYVKVVVPVHEKMNAASFQLGSFGFNSLTFTVPPAAASYYQRLDCRDSLGLYVDVIAGYDVVNNNVFWEFQSIDPVTFLPPADPLKGFLLLQDSSNLTYGHGFVNFSIKPVSSAQTLDSILARADIVFDSNDTIPTNIEKNTIDALPPTSQMGSLPTNSTNPLTLNWSGTDDINGCGVHFYTLYISDDGVNFSVLKDRMIRTDTILSLTPNIRYYFFVLATDSVGNRETLRPGEIKSTFIGVALPVTWLYFRGTNRNKDNILDWATANEQNAKEFRVQRSLDGNSFSDIGTVAAAGNSNNTNTYSFTDKNIDRLNSSVMYYRLRQVDLDNNYRYSSIIRLTYKEKEARHSIVYPNPASTMVTITVGDKKLIGTVAAVFDMNGKLLENFTITSESQTFDISKYMNGIYLIRLENKETLRIVKQ